MDLLYSSILPRLDMTRISCVMPGEEDIMENREQQVNTSVYSLAQRLAGFSEPASLCASDVAR